MTVIKKSNMIIGIAENKEKAMKFVLENNYPQFLNTVSIERAWDWAGRNIIGLNQIYTFIENIPMV